MARGGDALENPITRERIVFRETARETGGERLAYELFFVPRGFLAHDHVHPKQEERHEVVTGTLRMSVAGRERVLEPGDVEVVPRGTRHRIWTEDEREVHLRIEISPALRREQLIETFVGLARDGKVNEKGYPNLLQRAVIVREYGEEGYQLRPPPAAQKLVFAPLAALGRLRGYRSWYPEYGSP
ncbi:MAG: cupin domain-containing protein [Actinomycetota bacterium]|nr:cupin domain-containing protein [Actinomycetota bacterium]